MPRNQKKTKQEHEDEWRRAALELTKVSLLKSKHPCFLKPFRKGKLHGGAAYELNLYVQALYDIICGAGSTAKARTRFMDCMFPIPDLSLTNYSRMNKFENAGGLWEALGLNKVLPDNHSHFTDTIKENASNGKVYLQLPGMVMPEYNVYPHEFTIALSEWFGDHVPRRHLDTGLRAVTCRLYLSKGGDSPLSGDYTKRSSLITALLGVKDQIEAIEAKRADLCELSKDVLEILKNNLQSFDVEADNDSDEDEDSGSDEDSDEDTGARKKRKRSSKHETTQKIDIHTIEAVKGQGLNDPRDARRRDFKGETDPHVVELLMALFLDKDHMFQCKFLPTTIAPRFSSGAELVVRGGRHTFEQPGDAVEGDTIMTQRWAHTHNKQQREEEMGKYLKAHDMAADVRKMTGELVDTLRKTFSMSLCFEGHDNELIFELDSPVLTLLQKKALFNVFMASIWTPPVATAEGESEEDEESGASDDDSDDDSSDDEYCAGSQGDSGSEGSDGEDDSDSDSEESGDDDDDSNSE
jgi:hypothetical protein